MNKTIAGLLAYVALLLCGGVWAATPVAVWDGDLDVLNKDGYTLNLNDNTGTKDAITIGSKGVKVTIPGNGFENYMGSIIVQYSGVTAYPSATKALATFDSNRDQDYTGVCVRDTGDVYGVLTGSDWNNSGSNVSSGKIPLTEGSHRLGFIVEMTRSNVKRRGTHACIDGTSVYSVGGLVGSETVVTGFCIGGEDKTTLGSLEGMVIEKIAVFNDALTNDEVTNFKFPSETTYYTATVSSDVTWANLAWTDSKTWGNDNSCDATISVTADAKLTIGAAVTAKKVRFDIAEGKTLTLAGNNAITTSDNIYVTGKGTIKFTNSTNGFTPIGGTNLKMNLGADATMLIYHNNTWDYSVVNFKNISGTGAIKLEGSNWQRVNTTAANIWSTDHDTINNLASGVILGAGQTYTFANLSGSGTIRTDWGGSANDRSATVYMTKDTTWSGKIYEDGTSRFSTLTITGSGDTKTLTFTGDSTSQAGALTVDVSGSMKMNGTWKAKNTVALNGEFGGTGMITDPATITVGVGAKIRADWGVVTLNKAPTVGAFVDVVATEIPANNKVKLFAGTSFTQPDGWTTAYARVLVGATVHYGTVAVEADGVYATISDDAMTAAIDAAAKYKYEMNGSFENSASSGVNLTVGGSFAAGDFRESKVLSLGTNVGSHWGSAGFAYGSGAWTIVTAVKAPSANQCVFAVGGAKGVAGMLGLRNAGSNTMKLFTANATDLCGVTLEVDPTAAFHYYTIVYENGTIKMNVDGGAFCAPVPFTPGTGTGWQMGGIVSGGNTGHSVNATSGEMDFFRMYSFPFVLADTKAKASIGDAKFHDLTTALTLAEAGDTVTLLAATAETVTIPSNVTVDAAGFAFTGAVSGAGKIKFAGFAPIKDATTLKTSLQDSENWTGTLVVTQPTTGQIGNGDNTVGSGYKTLLNDYGNVNSKIEFQDCTYSSGNLNYFGLTTGDDSIVQPEIVITGELKLCNGYSYNGSNGYKTIFRKLSGTGTIMCPRTDLGPRLYFMDGSSFEGTINTSGYKFYFGSFADSDPAPAAGAVIIKNGATATVAAGKTWTAAGGVKVDGTLKFTEDASALSAITRNNQFSLIGSGLIDLSEAKGQSTSANNLRIAIRGANHTFTGDVNVPENVNLVFGAADTDCTGMKFGGGGFVCVLGTSVNLNGTWTTAAGAYIGAGATLNANGGTLTGRLYLLGNSNLSLGSLTETSLTVSGERFETAGVVHITLPSGEPANERTKLIAWNATRDVTAAKLDVANVPVGYETSFDETGLYLGPIADLVEPRTTDVANCVTMNSLYIGANGVQSFTGVGGVKIGDLQMRDGAKLVIDPIKNPMVVATAPTFESGAKIALSANYATTELGKFTLMTWTGDAVEIPDGLFDTNSLTSDATATLTCEAAPTAGQYQLILRVGDYENKAQTIRIMPLGDSITDGTSKHAGVYEANPNYRVPLMQKLAAAGYKPVATGLRECAFDNRLATDASGVVAPGEYRWHSGVSGARVRTAFHSGTRGVNGGWREAIEATLDAAGDIDVITLMIGTNDMGDDVNLVFAGWKELVWRILEARPNVKIVVSTIPDYDGITKDDEYNTLIKNQVALQPGQDGAFPAGRVFQVDLNTACPRNTEPKGKYFKSSGDLHPNWMGHDLTSSEWLRGVLAAIESINTTPVDTFVKNTNTGAAANIPVAYRKGYEQLRTFALPSKADQAGMRNVALTYTKASSAFDTTALSRVAYYLELKNRKTQHVRFVWVSMDAWSDNKFIGEMGVPTQYYKFGAVENLQVYSNDGGIHTTEPDATGIGGYLQFTFGGVGAGGDVTSAPTKIAKWDWNDSVTLSNDTPSGNYGVMQVYRVFNPVEADHNAAETLFAFNRWTDASTSTTTEVGIGNFAMHGAFTGGDTSNGSINYMFTSGYTTIDASAYELMNLEIWGKPDITSSDKTIEVSDDGELVSSDGDATVEVFKGAEKQTSTALPTETGVYTVVTKSADDAIVAVHEVAVVKVDPVVPEQQGQRTTTLVAVPFKGLDGENVTVDKLINTATLSEGDALKIYQGGYYYHWTLNAQKQWVAGKTVAASDVVTASEPGVSPVDRGVAVWVTTADPIVVYGVESGTVVKATAGVNLLGNTTLGVLEPAAAEGDKVEIPGDTSGVRTFTKTATGWSGVKTVYAKDAQGNVILISGLPVKKDEPTTQAPNVPAGRGYFLRRQ